MVVMVVVSGVVKGFGLLRIWILGIVAFGFLIYDVVTFAFSLAAANCTVVEIFK